MFRYFYNLRNTIALFFLCSAIALGMGRVERTGDHLQVALPAAGLVCAATNGQAASYILRFVGTQVVVHATKRGTVQVPLNARPSGGQHGFPSGHTAAAAFGTSSLVQDCLRGNPWMQAVTILSGAYVGASRIEAGAHFLFQVLAGAIIGWLGERSVLLFRLARLWIRRSAMRRIKV